MRPRRNWASAISWSGLALGPVFALLIYVVLPAAALHDPASPASGIPHAARAAAAVGMLMVVWWLTEAIPLPATSLIPLVAFPLLGVVPIDQAAAPYASSVVFLFLGGFILGLGMERWGLHKRIALITVLVVGAGPKRLIAGFMIATACIGQWVSNTSTAIIMLPIALSVIALVAERHASPGTPPDKATSPDPNFDACLLLGIAYSASISGVGTLIGTPPNMVLAAYARDHLGRALGFAEWMRVGIPLVVIFLPLAWLYLTHVGQPVRLKTIPGGRALIRGELAALGRMARGEWIVLGAFMCAALLWVFRPILADLGATRGLLPLAGLNDASIGIAAALALFIIPVSVRERRFSMDWATAQRVPWGTLLLFGGGLSLAAAVSSTGLDRALGSLFSGLSGLPPWLVILIVVAGVVFLSELTSNTALATVVMPVLAAAAPSMGIQPMRLLIPATIAASWAFMLPVGTPPNALVFGTGRVPMGQMARTGLGLNVLGVVIITAFSVVAGEVLA